MVAADEAVRCQLREMVVKIVILQFCERKGINTTTATIGIGNLPEAHASSQEREHLSQKV
jgi:hypothetical protein